MASQASRGCTLGVGRQLGYERIASVEIDGCLAADRVAAVSRAFPLVPADADANGVIHVLPEGQRSYPDSKLLLAADLDDPDPLVGALTDLADARAVVSIVAKDQRAFAVRPALEGDRTAALASFDAARQVNGLGVDTRADTVADLGDHLLGHGVEPVAWCGVRLFTAGWTPERPALDDEEPVLALELEASRRDPYRQLSRLFHLVGVRRDGVIDGERGGRP